MLKQKYFFLFSMREEFIFDFMKFFDIFFIFYYDRSSLYEGYERAMFRVITILYLYSYVYSK